MLSLTLHGTWNIIDIELCFDKIQGGILKMQYIRADANSTIGTGHIMRCLAIANEFFRQGEDVTFIVADYDSFDLIRQHGFQIICLNSMWSDLDKETNTIIQLIAEQHITLLIIDSYFVTKSYLKSIAQHTKVAYIDDINQFIYPVDYLINYNIYAPSMGYITRYQKSGLNTCFVLGCKYIPLREEFIQVKKEINQTVSRILITTGGTDPYNIAGGLLEILYAQPWFGNMKFDVVIGMFNTNKEILKQKWSSFPNIRLLYNVTNMSYYMKQCDIAVTAAGVTTYELCACGVPSIIYTLADNQLNIARTFSELNLIPWAGDIRDHREKCFKNILYHIESYLNNTKLRQLVSHKMQITIDGNGCHRIVQILTGKQQIEGKYE